MIPTMKIRVGYLDGDCKVFKDGIWKCVLREFEGFTFGKFVFISLVQPD